METDSKALLLLWEKDIKENNCSLRRDGEKKHMTEGEWDKKESEKSTQNPWLSSLTCHQPDNNIPPDLNPITTYTNNNSVIPTPHNKVSKQRICLLKSGDVVCAFPKHWCRSLVWWSCFNLRKIFLWMLSNVFLAPHILRCRLHWIFWLCM